MDCRGNFNPPACNYLQRVLYLIEHPVVSGDFGSSSPEEAEQALSLPLVSVVRFGGIDPSALVSFSLLLVGRVRTCFYMSMVHTNNVFVMLHCASPLFF